MASLHFKPEEITNALPTAKDGVGSAAAWQMFTTMEGVNEAADFVNRCIMRALTQDDGVPFKVGSDIRAHVEDISNQLNDMVYKALKKRYGHGYGFGDTEPRVECYRFYGRLVGLK